jgi:hypothetical protein
MQHCVFSKQKTKEQTSARQLRTKEKLFLEAAKHYCTTLALLERMRSLFNPYQLMLVWT